MSLDNQKTLYSEYRGLGDYNRQSIYLSGCMSKTEPKRRIAVSSRKRRVVWHYKMKLNGNTIVVCQMFFRKVLRETTKRLEILQNKILSGSNVLDDRGKHATRPNKVDADAWTLLHVYCAECIPHAPSHYSHTKTDRQYFLNPDLSMKKLYKGFVDYYGAVTGKDLRLAFNTFERHFVTREPYGFRLPRTDVCNLCYEHELKRHCTPEEKTQIRLHKKKVEGYKYLKQSILDKAEAELDHTIVLEFDYAQNLPLPKVPVTDQFYKRLLLLFVFNVHVHKRNTSYMYHFLEGLSKKGANSVCSFLLDVIQQEKKNAKEVFLFSDACSGQNRNWTVVAFLMAVATELSLTITHVFPVRGHSYCQCDRNFALYSRQVKKTETIEVPADYIRIIEGCKVKDPFIVKEVAVNDFSTWRNRFRMPKDLKLSKSVVIKYHPTGMLEVHPNYAQLTPSVFNVCKKSKSETSVKCVPLDKPATVAPAKAKDVLSLINYISPSNRHFYFDYLKGTVTTGVSLTSSHDTDAAGDASDLEY